MTQGPPGSVGFSVSRQSLVHSSCVFIPEIAAFPDALAQAGEGTDGGGVISQHIFRKMAGETPALKG